MARDTVVRARISGAVKEEAAQILEQMGLSISDAIRLLMVRIAREKALPFEVMVPNAETVAAMQAARRGEGTTFNSVADLMKDLNADDPADERLQARLSAREGQPKAPKIGRATDPAA